MRNIRQYCLKWMDIFISYDLSISYIYCARGGIHCSRKAAAAGQIAKDLDRLFHSLGYVGQRHAESLDGREGILEIQCVSVAVDPAKLHHLEWALILRY